MITRVSEGKTSVQAVASPAQRRGAAAAGAVVQPIAQLAREINAGSRAQSLAQLRQQIDQSPRMQTQLRIYAGSGVLQQSEQSPGKTREAGYLPLRSSIASSKACDCGVGTGAPAQAKPKEELLQHRAMDAAPSGAASPAPPVQRAASMSDVKSAGAKVLKERKEKGPAAQRKISGNTAVVQRLVNPPIALGNPYTFQVVPADLGTGTATTPGTRAYVNGAAPLFPTVSFAYAFYPPGAPGPVGGAAPGALTVVPNPPPAFGNYDAGHALGRQNGGLGHVNTWVFPQDANINRGWGGTFGLWRAHENAFNAGVAGLAPGGFGIWHVQQP